MMTSPPYPSQPVPLSRTGPTLRRALAVGAVFIIALPALAAAGGQQPNGAVRATDLALLENALETTIQTAIERAIATINAEQAQAASETPETPDRPRPGIVASYQLRSSGETHARGMFLEGYGVIFQVQVPALGANTFVNWAISPEPGGVTIVTPEGDTGLAAEIRLRTQMTLLQREIDELTRRLQAETRQGGTSDAARELQQALRRLETTYETFRRQVSTEARDETERQEAAARDERRQRPAAVAEAIAVPRPERPGYSVLDMSATREQVEVRKSEIEEAVLEAVFDTLAHYGRILHGLGNDDRLAVVLLPSSYTIQRWLRATERPEEFIISVAYGDVMAFDREEIDEAEFGQRIRVESRLGQPRDAIRLPERR